MCNSSKSKGSPLYFKDDAYLSSVMPRRIALFESIKSEQEARLQSIGGETIKVTLPDGTVKEGKKWLSTPFDIAKETSDRLASHSLVSQVNGVLGDMFRPLEGDCDLKLFTFDTDIGRDTLAFKCSHLRGYIKKTHWYHLFVGQAKRPTPTPADTLMMRGSLRQEWVFADPLPESQFSLAIVRVAVAQICKSTGFKGAQNSALEALAEVASRYLQEIAKLAAASANSDGRTESNLPDIIVALEDLSSIQGYLGLSNVRSPSLYTSAVVRDLMNFVKYTYEIPFARPLPPRKVYYSKGKKFLKRGNSSSGSRGYCDGGRWGHVPRWLPAVPVVEVKEKVVETEKEVIWGSMANVKSEEDKKLKYHHHHHHHQESEIHGNREKTGVVGNLRGTGTEKCSLVNCF